MKALLVISRLPTGHHAMRVGDRWDGNNTDRRSSLHEASVKELE
jgi:hypothetical protein